MDNDILKRILSHKQVNQYGKIKINFFCFVVNMEILEKLKNIRKQLFK